MSRTATAIEQMRDQVTKVDPQTVMQLVNTGVISVNTARDMLGLEQLEEFETYQANLKEEIAAVYGLPKTTFTVKPPQYPTENVAVNFAMIPFAPPPSDHNDYWEHMLQTVSSGMSIPPSYLTGTSTVGTTTGNTNGTSIIHEWTGINIQPSPPLDIEALQAAMESWKTHTFEKHFSAPTKEPEKEPELEVEPIPLFAKRRIRLID